MHSTLLLGTLVFAPLLSPLLFLLWPASVISRRLVLSQKGELMHPEEQPLLLLREDAKDGDVWVLSDQAIYVGLKTRDRRPGWRIRRDDVLDASHAAMGDLVVVTLRIDGDMEPTRVVTGCFNPFGQEREVRKLLKELGSPSTS